MDGKTHRPHVSISNTRRVEVAIADTEHASYGWRNQYVGMTWLPLSPHERHLPSARRTTSLDFASLTVLSDSFREIALHRRDWFPDLIEPRRRTSLHQHQAA